MTGLCVWLIALQFATMQQQALRIDELTVAGFAFFRQRVAHALTASER